MRNTVAEHQLATRQPGSRIVPLVRFDAATGHLVSLNRRWPPWRSNSRVPDGRSVRTLINVTPIRSEVGGIVSVVVTMQNLAAFEELER